MATDETADVRHYQAKSGSGWQATLFIAGGVLFLLMLLLQFLLLLVGKPQPHHDVMPGIIGGMSVVGIGLIGRGVFLLRGVRRVVATAELVIVEGFASRAEVRWADIARIERVKRAPLLGGDSVDVLVLLAENGRPLVSIPATVEPFGDLCRVAEARSAAARGRATFDPRANEARQQAREARKMRWVAAAFLLFTLGTAAGFVIGVNEELHERRFATEAVVVPAKIVKHYMFRVTPRLEYAFTDAAGREHVRDVMMSQEGWQALQGAATVAVAYLPSDPDWNRLIAGRSAQEASFGGKFLFVTGAGFVLFGLLFVATALGFDLRTENGRTTLVRRGRVLREWGQAMEVKTQPASVAAAPPPPLPPPVTRRSRPVGIVALGVLCMIFGCGGAVLAVGRAILAARGVIELPDGRVLLRAMPGSLRLWNAVDGLLGLLLLVAGVGLVCLYRPARYLALVIAALQLLSSVGGLVFVIVDMAQAPLDGPDVGANIVGAVIGKLLGAIFPIILLIVLARRHTSNAFE